jgi:hypothetical protein
MIVHGNGGDSQKVAYVMSHNTLQELREVELGYYHN